MRRFLIQDDVSLVETRLKQFEANTGCELLIVVTDACDPYPAAPWRFGFITTVALSLLTSFYFHFNHPFLWPVTFTVLMAFMTWIGHFRWAKKLALADWEMERECREKALELFHTLGSSKVTHKVTAMILVAELERRIEVLVDEKLKSQITQPELDELVSIMSKHFAKGNMGIGLVQSIESLEHKILKDFGGKVSDVPPSELKDTIHFLSLK